MYEKENLSPRDALLQCVQAQISSGSWQTIVDSCRCDPLPSSHLFVTGDSRFLTPRCRGGAGSPHRCVRHLREIRGAGAEPERNCISARTGNGDSVLRHFLSAVSSAEGSDPKNGWSLPNWGKRWRSSQALLGLTFGLSTDPIRPSSSPRRAARGPLQGQRPLRPIVQDPFPWRSRMQVSTHSGSTNRNCVLHVAGAELSDERPARRRSTPVADGSEIEFVWPPGGTAIAQPLRQATDRNPLPAHPCNRGAFELNVDK
jgi:hypothetical protein